MTTIDNDAAVRDRAYFLWEQAGRPAGREHEFWAQASREIEGDPSSDSKGTSNPSSGGVDGAEQC